LPDAVPEIASCMSYMRPSVKEIRGNGRGRPHEREPDPNEASNRPFVDKGERGLNHPAEAPDPTADGDPYAPAPEPDVHAPHGRG
jgi:hypothetical protein